MGPRAAGNDAAGVPDAFCLRRLQKISRPPLPAAGLKRVGLGLFHEAGFETHCDTVHFARNFMVAVAQADGFGFGAALEHLRAAEFQILDQDDAIAIGEDIAVGIFDDARAGGGFGFRRALPFMAAGDAFVAFGMFQNLGHFAHRAGGRFAHKAKRIAGHCPNLQATTKTGSALI